ncbi:hypothetical protein JAAARDRAFT_150177 [Jaapia argillacea MUCL 33604]|uniref:FAD-binding domain-containing protein n=1 Tax=Jaapia argillacea MUCL 33604 TaxID=933084 RepID=A0A067QDA2_9AGAM|nr:hypothetical protein JAAARDRAFT_150177 [Jaapia argillacea MUCL 33604]
MPVSLVKESDVDVLVIGAGPAGLMCANALTQAGVNVRIVDKKPVKVEWGQADGIQPRTIEVLQSYGLAERLLKDGAQMHMAAFYSPGPNGGIARTARVKNIGHPTARYPFGMTLRQGSIEDIFLNSMASKGVEVERSTVPTHIELSTDDALLQDPQSYAVKVVLNREDVPDGMADKEIVHAKYVVGADGAHSWVRRTLGINMDGEQTDYIWGVLDIVPDTDFPDIRNRCSIHSTNGSCMIIPREGDVVRLYIQLTDADVRNVNTGRVDMSRCTPEKLLQTAKKSFYPYTMGAIGEVEWWTIYIIGQRVASQFSVNDRIFIAGDACHTHSPKAGQGMNASMNDTHNLSWKLAHVLRGQADFSLLKTYEFERRKYAQDLIDFDKRFSALFSGKPRTEHNQDGVSHEDFLQAFRTFGGFTSGIGIHYAESAIVNYNYQGLASGVAIGQRMGPQIVIRVADARPFDVQDLLPADTRFKILIFAGDLTEPEQREKLNLIALEMGKPEGFLEKYTPKGAARDAVFDIMTIGRSKKEDLNFTDVPDILLSHWSKVYVDDIDFTGTKGGKAYSTYGIGSAGAFVVVRPDQYVGMIAPLDRVKDLDRYFAGFMGQKRRGQGLWLYKP